MVKKTFYELYSRFCCFIQNIFKTVAMKYPVSHILTVFGFWVNYYSYSKILCPSLAGSVHAIIIMRKVAELTEGVHQLVVCRVLYPSTFMGSWLEGKMFHRKGSISNRSVCSLMMIVKRNWFKNLGWEQGLEWGWSPCIKSHLTWTWSENELLKMKLLCFQN